MSAKVVASVNREGVGLVHAMLLELGGADEDKAGLAPADYACLEEWPRQGMPFRNVVSEYLETARKLGPEVEAGFCAALTDMAALVSTGMGPDSDRYLHFYKRLAKKARS